jgi:hypothetical protein
MKELTDLTINSISNQANWELVADENFRQVKEAINLLQTTFGITIEIPGFDSQNSNFLLNTVKANSIKLPTSGAVKIGLDGANGGITGASFNVLNSGYVGGDLVLYNKNGTGGRVKFRVDRNTEITKPADPGDVRFTGNSFQGYVYQGDISSKFTFSINSGSSGGTISVVFNGTTITTTTWQGAVYTTCQKIVADILAIDTTLYPIKASSDATSVTIESLPGYSAALNGTTIVLTTSNISTTPSTGEMLGGIEGSKGWVDFSGYIGSTGATGPTGDIGITGPTGPANGPTGPSGTSGSSGRSGTSGSSGSSGSSGQTGSSGTSGTIGPTGPTGDVGTQGPRGATGAAGTSGTTGSSGSSGTTGTSGSSGRSGTSGSTGSSGSSGVDGTFGSSGSSGSSGSTGTSGSSGTNGSSGTSGLTGSSGTSGSSGLAGDRYGSVIYSTDGGHTTNISLTLAPSLLGTTVPFNTAELDLAYTVAQNVIIAKDALNYLAGTVTSYVSANGEMEVLVNDVEGTDSGIEWYVNLDGAVGPSGSSGTSGANGTSGSAGSSGRTGSSGSSGSSGSTGTSGSAGSTGTSGSSGTSGTDGSSGSSGSTGSSGSSGSTGTSGSSGSTGTSGSSGSSGATGSSGTSGANGSSGSSGINGSSGSSGINGSSGSSGATGSSGSSGATGSSGSSGATGSSGTSGVGGANGTSTQVAFFTGTTTLGSDSGLYWDNTNKRLSIGAGTNPAYPLEVEGNVSNISIYADFDIAAYSDISVKENIEEIPNAVEKIKQIRGVTFTRKDSENKSRRAGVIAQEVQKVLPEVITEKEDGTLMVSYGNLASLLIQAIKEQQAKIEELESIIKKG